jgi:hypothetical protein
MSRKHDPRKPSYWTREQAQGWGPHIVARLVAGETVDCAGFLLRLAPEELASDTEADTKVEK